MLYIEKKIEDDIYLNYVKDITKIESFFIKEKLKQSIYIKEIKILNNINIYFNDDYYYNKYKKYDMSDTIKENMGLCYENNCYNIIKENEDLCHKHWYEQNIDDYDENGIKIIIKEYDKYKNKKKYLGGPNYYGNIIKFSYKGIIYNK